MTLSNNQPEQPHRAAKPMRDSMPGVTAFIDSMRESFGAEAINQAMRAGLQSGEFWASEGAQMIGAPWCHFPRAVPCEAPGKAAALADKMIDLSPAQRQAIEKGKR